MSYLPREILQAKVLITVKTYPQPSDFYGEIVCTAGLLENGKWVRIYPVPFRLLSEYNKFKKYNWIEIDLKKHRRTDFRPETYSPKSDVDQDLKILSKLGTENNWQLRKEIVLKDVFTSFNELIELSLGEEKISLETLKPKKIIDFYWKETEREWPKKWLGKLQQLDFFNELNLSSIVRKLPYKFYYKFITEEDNNPRKIEIIDWEIGALFWNCLKSVCNNEQKALKLVRKKYFEDFAFHKDLHFFVGTNYKWQNKRSPNPFMIIGLFYPPKMKENTQLKFDL